MLNHLLVLLNDFAHIFSKRRGLPGSFRLLRTHMRLKLKQKFFAALGAAKTEERFLGLRAEFPDYGSFCHMWREIFILETYYFKSDNDAPRIVDVGSNIGMSVCYFKLLYPAANIIAFEPDPGAFAFLKRNVAANGFAGVEVQNAAVSGKTGAVAFYQYAGRPASAINSTTENFLPTGTQTRITVRSVRLSGYIAKKKVDLLKICAEGAEYEILEEAEKSLGLVRRIVSLVHQRDGARNENIPKLLNLLQARGFRYAITYTPISHADFAENSSRAYAFLLDAARV